MVFLMDLPILDFRRGEAVFNETIHPSRKNRKLPKNRIKGKWKHLSGAYMKRVIYHLLLPVFLPVVFFKVATTPVEVLGCRTRGLIALSIALGSGLAALGIAIIGAKGRSRSNPHAIWWISSSIILAIPVVAFLILA